MSLKRIFALLSAIVVLIACLSLTTFAVEPDEYELAFGSYNVYQAEDSDYSIDFSNPDGFVYLDYKNYIGSLRVERRALTQINVEPELYRFDFNVGFGLVTEDYNPRFKVGAFDGSAIINEGVNVGSVGYTFRTNDMYDVLYIYRSVGLVNSTTRFTFGSEYLVEIGDYTTVVGYMEYDYNTGYITLFLYRSSTDSFVAVDSYACEIYNYNCTFQCYDRILNGSYPSARFMLSPAYYTLYDREYYYNQGYNEGYDDGYSEGREDGIIDGRDEGYDDGYADGLLDGERSEIAVPEVISTIMNSTVTLFRNIFGFELFGINISALIGSISLICVLAWLIRKLVK